MGKFSIIHLSDLHISAKEDPSFERIRESLIEDILALKQENNICLDVIVLTGDIVEKGGKTEDYIKATEFLDRLSKKNDLSLDRVLTVPGNHDIPRRPFIPAIIKNILEEDTFDINKFEEYWEALGSRFNIYNRFREGLGKYEDYDDGMFGGAISSIKTRNGTLQFILLNSSWATVGNSDYGSLLIGRCQLESLISLRNNEADLTITMMHHPLDWLLPAEKDMLVEYLRNEKLLKTDALLHGHIHSGGIDKISDPDGELIYLVSGIGFPEANSRQRGQPKLSHCRYAVYQFNVNEGIVNIWLRTTRDDGTFVADTQLYRAGKKDGSFSIKFKKNLLINDLVVKENIEVDPVPLVSDWVGRELEIKRLLNPKLRASSITGVGGQGKTFLAAQFLRRFARGKESIFDVGVWANCRELPDSLHLKVIQILDALSGGRESATLYRDEKFEDTVKRFLKRLQSRRILLVFDNIDAYIQADTEGPSGELKPFVDVILNNEHSSLVIFTCRSPFNDHRGSFRHIQLGGLNSQEGIDFFRKRNINLMGENSEDYCVKLVKLTSGHPWWLGLIAGQVQADQDTLKRCVDKFSHGEVTEGRQIKDYFDDIWSQLGKNSQKFLRHLVESPKPLTEFEINIVVYNIGPQKIKQMIRRLERIGLIEPHEGTIANTRAYQVHPLLRQFVHESYSFVSQRPYVSRILRVFLPQSIVDILFINSSALDKYQSLSMSPSNLVDSVETCLSSRNYLQSLELLERFYIILSDGGYHHQFLSLACRVLDSVNWDEVRLVQRHRSASFLTEVITLLGYMGETHRSDLYLQRYESSVEPNTVHQLRYLSVASFGAWLAEKYDYSLELANKYDELCKRLDNKEYLKNVEHTRALSLRDSGNYEEALELFCRDNSDKGSKYGNIARCYIKLKKYKEAENNLRRSLSFLLKESIYMSRTNTGYAYMWIAEVMYEQERFIEAKAFQILARELWGEYAPGLLNKLDSIEHRLSKNDNNEPVSIYEAREIEKIFLEEEDLTEIKEDDSA